MIWADRCRPRCAIITEHFTCELSSLTDLPSLADLAPEVVSIETSSFFPG
jgi:hypothetical protein